jgi:hypothetical protein
MECHRCEHQAAVKAGLYRGVAFAQTPCGKCQLRDRIGYDPTFDAERGAADGLAAGERPEAPKRAQLTLEEISTRDLPFPEEYIEDDPVIPMSVLGDVILRLLTMPPRTRDVVCWRFAGQSYREIGRMLGVSMAAAELRHRRALAKWPALRVLFSQKAMKQERRKVPGAVINRDQNALLGRF